MENKNMNEIELENVNGGAAYVENCYIVKKGDIDKALQTDIAEADFDRLTIR